MLAQLIRFATTYPKRVIAVWLVVGLGLAGVASLASYSVMTDDTAEFLPSDSQSAQAVRYARDAFKVPEGTATVTVLVERADGAPLTDADQDGVAELAAGMPRFRTDLDPLREQALYVDVAERAGRVVDASVGPVADGGRFQLVAALYDANTTDPVAQAGYRQFRDRVSEQAGGRGLRVAFTNGIASAADTAKASEPRQIAGQVALLGAVLLLSLLFFRGPLAALLPLLAIIVVAGAAGGLVILSALAFGFQLDPGTPQLITVLLVGVGIDYFLFLLFRLRENLRAGEDRRTAAANAAARVGPVIASAALVVVAAFATLGLAEFGQFRVLGPSIAISVLVMLLAGVTLMPAITAVTGRALFWPSKSWMRDDTDGRAARLGTAIARRPARAALAVTAVLLALAGAGLATKSSYDLGTSGPATAATRTADKIAETLPEGAIDPQPVYVDSEVPLTPAALEPLRRSLERVAGVGSVSEPVLTEDRRGGRMDLALDAEATSTQAMQVVRGPLRDVARQASPPQSTALIAGNAAVFADVSDAIDRDLKLVFPIAAALILLILILTLRSVAAPLYLLVAVGLEFAATLGATVLAFQLIGGASGVAFTLPLVLFLFVVAVGTDYNLLMTSRLREEMLAGTSPRQAVAEAVRRVAPAIGAAGLVLASSFGTLMLEADENARQTGFALAFGILLASLVVSTILVPALTALAGRGAWWPGRLSRKPERPKDDDVAPRRSRHPHDHEGDTADSLAGPDPLAAELASQATRP